MSKRRALISVSDKAGVVELARGLVGRGWEVLSTGGTARILADAGVPVIEVADATGHPEMMDGRVKTLHPAIHAGLLARREHGGDLEELAGQGYGPIDLVAVNLYPFRETVARPGVTLERAMEDVDIGGPALLRAGAKNHRGVWVVADPADYDEVLHAVSTRETEVAAAGLRRRLAAKVFQAVSDYDSAVARYLADGADDVSGETSRAGGIELGLERWQSLRYGENPDQTAAFYVPKSAPATGVAALVQLHGKELSYNNILDLDGAMLALAPFAFAPNAAVCIVKHTTPCGLAVRPTVAVAFDRARATDPVSAFGSVIASNRPVDEDAARAIGSVFVECLVAPAFSDEALEVLAAKKNLRLLKFPARSEPHPLEPAGEGWRTDIAEAGRGGGARFLASRPAGPGAAEFRSVYGGMLAQSPTVLPFFASRDRRWKVVTRREPSDAEQRDLDFAWAAVAPVKSNAILLAKDTATVGIGAGQMSRVDSSRLAVRKARDAALGTELEGAALASDAFFPFRDGVDAAAAAGIRAIIQPGGSLRDAEVIAAADEHGVAMVFTGRRLFRH